MTDAIQHPFPDPPAEGTAIEVAPGILWLRLPLPMALDHVNVYALEDGPGWAIVDTGLHSRRGVALWERLLAGPLAGRPVTRVIVTHHHPDHVGMAGWFQARGAELLTTRVAWLYARMLTLDVQPLPTRAVDDTSGAGRGCLPTGLPPARPNGRSTLPMSCIRCRSALPGSPKATGCIWRGATGGCGSAMAMRPIMRRCGPTGIVIGGDQLLPGISANIGVYPTEPEADPLTDWLESCAAFQPHARAGDLILPGHKLPFTGLPFRLEQMIDNHIAALDRLREHLAQPRTAIDCFAVLFKRPIGLAEEGLALVEAVAHLNCLLRRGAVSRSLTDRMAPIFGKGCDDVGTQASGTASGKGPGPGNQGRQGRKGCGKAEKPGRMGL